MFDFSFGKDLTIVGAKSSRTISTQPAFAAVAKPSDIIPADGESGSYAVVKLKLVVGRNAVVIYWMVSTANGHRDTVGSSGVHGLMEHNGCQLV